MGTWQYATLSIFYGTNGTATWSEVGGSQDWSGPPTTAENTLAWLNRAGAEGWELVEVPKGGSSTFYFKRAIS